MFYRIERENGTVIATRKFANDQEAFDFASVYTRPTLFKLIGSTIYRWNSEIKAWKYQEAK